MIFILTLVSLLVVSFNSFADQHVNTNTLEFYKEAIEMAPQGLLPFIGFRGGYTGNNSNVPVEGAPVSLKVLGSYYLTQPYVFDAGFGISNQQFSQTGAKEVAATGSSLELAARYRFANEWQAGVVANQLFQMGSYYAASQGDAQFVGLQVMKEFSIAKGWLARAGGRAMTETNNTGEMVNMYMFDLQLGWNPHAQATTVKSSAISEEKTVPVTNIVKTEPTSKLESINYASLQNGQNILFKEASTTLDSKNQAQLKKLASLWWTGASAGALNSSGGVRISRTSPHRLRPAPPGEQAGFLLPSTNKTLTYDEPQPNRGLMLFASHRKALLLEPPARAQGGRTQFGLRDRGVSEPGSEPGPLQNPFRSQPIPPYR